MTAPVSRTRQVTHHQSAHALNGHTGRLECMLHVRRRGAHAHLHVVHRPPTVHHRSPDLAKRHLALCRLTSCNMMDCAQSTRRQPYVMSFFAAPPTHDGCARRACCHNLFQSVATATSSLARAHTTFDGKVLHRLHTQFHTCTIVRTQFKHLLCRVWAAARWWPA